MRYLVTVLIILCSFSVKAQTDDGLLVAKRIGLDTTISGALAFNEELLKCSPGYTFKYVDKQPGGISEMKYLYEHTNHETLKLEYTYRNRQVDSTGKTRPIVFTQRIIADNATITTIYNCIFSEALMPGQLEAYSGGNFGFTCNDKGYHYSLMPDDYKPGYWILTFTE